MLFIQPRVVRVALKEEALHIIIIIAQPLYRQA